jgi:hypothetical protein
VKDQSKIKSLEKYGNIIFASRLTKTIGLEAPAGAINAIKNDPNVISVRPSKKGQFQPVMV